MRSEDDDERIFRRLQRKPGTNPAVKPVVKPAAKSGHDRFVKVPLWWAAAAAEAIRATEFLVCLELLHRAWKVRSATFALPNGWLKEKGISRKVKYRILRDLEAAKLIVIERRVGKSLRVTLVAI